MFRSFDSRLWILSLVISLSGTCLFAAWEPLPAGPAEILSVAADASGQELYAMVRGAGLWVSSDGGASWEPVFSPPALPRGIDRGTVWALDPAADTLIVRAEKVSGISACVYSFDGGASWHLPTPASVRNGRDLKIWSGGHHVWYSLGSDSLRVSTDYGQTWTRRATGTRIGQPRRLFEDGSGDSTLHIAGVFVAEWDHPAGGLYRTTIPDVAPWAPEMDLFNPYAASTWEVKGLVRLSDSTLLATVEVSAPERWLDGTLLKSTDNGSSWERRFVLPPESQATTILEDAGQAGRLFVLGRCLGGVLRSDDFGETWQPAANGLPDRFAYGLELHQNAHSGHLYACVEGFGLYVSTDHGALWEAIDGPATGAQGGFSLVAGDLYFHSHAGTADRRWQLDAAGTGWTPLPIPAAPGDTLSFAGNVLCSIQDTLYSLYTKLALDSTRAAVSHLTYSTDGGGSWVEGAPLLHPLDPYFASMSPSAQGPCLVARVFSGGPYMYDTLYVTVDLGQNWFRMSQLPQQYSPMEMEQQPGTVYVIGGDWSGLGRRVYQSIDYGVSWIGVLPEGSGYRALAPSGSQLFVAMQNRVLQWIGGTTWRTRGAVPVLTVGATEPWDMVVVPEPRPMLVGARGDSAVLCISQDSAMTWQVRDLDFPFETQIARIHSLTYDSVRHRLWASTGGGVAYLELAELASGDGPLVLKPADYSLLSVYPNPFNSTARMRYDLERAGRVELALYDLQGRKVATLVDDVQSAGRHELAFDGQALASGTYFARIQTRQDTRTVKVLLLK